MSAPAEIDRPRQHDLDQVSARRLTDQLRLALDGAWQLAIRAWEGRAWLALGYASWDDYCTCEFGACRLRLPHEDRDELLPSLSQAGMSTRAIASLTGVHHRTVQRSLAVGGQGGGAAASTQAVSGDSATVRIIGTDGKQYPSRRPTKTEVLVRRARVARLRNQGLSQTQIATELDVAQATVSADLAELSAMSGAAGVAELGQVLERARDDDGRTDAGVLAEYLGVDVAPTRDLGRLCRQPTLDLVATLSVLLEEVVLADEWLDHEERAAAVAVLTPALTTAVEHVRRIVAAFTVNDRSQSKWDALVAAIESLASASGSTASGQDHS